MREDDELVAHLARPAWYAALEGDELATFAHPQGRTVRVFTVPAEGRVALAPLAFLQRLQAQRGAHVLLFDATHTLVPRARLVPEAPLESLAEVPLVLELAAATAARAAYFLANPVGETRTMECPSCGATMVDGNRCLSCGWR